jgi:hypothetical protein
MSRWNGGSFISVNKNRSIQYLCATQYVELSGACRPCDSNLCPSSDIGAGRLAVLQRGPVCHSWTTLPALFVARKALGAPTGACPNCWHTQVVVASSDGSEPQAIIIRWRIRCHLRMPVRSTISAAVSLYSFWGALVLSPLQHCVVQEFSADRCLSNLGPLSQRGRFRDRERPFDRRRLPCV